VSAEIKDTGAWFWVIWQRHEPGIDADVRKRLSGAFSERINLRKHDGTILLTVYEAKKAGKR